MTDPKAFDIITGVEMSVQDILRMHDSIRKAWEILYAAVDDSPVIQQDLRPGDWQRLKYGALDAMHTLEAAMGGQSKEMP